MRRSLSLLVSGLLSVVVATSVHADAKTDFGQGLQMYNNRKNYAEAARLFRKAIAQSDQESRRPADAWIYGDFREEYLPHYWLARALVATGQCREAHAELTRSENQGALRLVPRYYKTVAKLRADCPLPPPTQVAETTTAPPPVVTPTGNGPDRSATGTIAAPPPITTTTPATRTIDPVVVSDTTTAPLSEADRSRPGTTLTPQPPFSTPARRDPPGPPAQLRKAVTEFFDGDYAKAVETLRNARFRDARAETQTRLIRGAARYSLYLVDGGKNPALREQALQDLVAFSNANPSGKIPFAGSFSPRLLKVLTDIRNR